MQKNDLVSIVSANTGTPKNATVKVVNGVFEAIAESLATGEKVTITGFGTFEVRNRAARDGVNPQSGAAIRIEARKTPGFSAGSPLKKAVNAQ